MVLLLHVEKKYDSEGTVVIFFDVLLAICVVLVLWFAGYVVYRLVVGVGVDRR